MELNYTREQTPQIAAIIPCYNEESSIKQVILDFQKYLDCEVYVFDNHSTDDTAAVAQKAGAFVFQVPQKGKGNVVRRMFSDVEANIYIMVDGDGTYDVSVAPELVNKLIDEHLDMVIGIRIDQGEKQNYRPGHRIGNKLLTKSVKSIFGGTFSDMLSGYRVFSRRYVKSFPAIATGFEIETELTVHALELRMPYGEQETAYGAREEGSTSKLSTYKDGMRILTTIIRLYMIERPFVFFGFFGLILSALAVILAYPIFEEYLKTRLVPRLPTAILSVGLILSAMSFFICGIILDSISRSRHEIRRLAYLAIPYFDEQEPQ